MGCLEFIRTIVSKHISHPLSAYPVIHDEPKKFAYQTGVKVAVAYGVTPDTYGPMGDQLRNLAKGVDILVVTPGCLVDMIERGKVSLCMVRYLALDETDRMLDMGFEPQISKIVQQMDMPRPGSRQTMLFSATFPTEIQRLASDFLKDYIFLTVGKVGSSTDLIEQKVEFVNESDKRQLLKDLLMSQRMNGTRGKPALTILFVKTKRGVDDLEQWLSRNGFPATAIHGDKVQWVAGVLCVLQEAGDQVELVLKIGDILLTETAQTLRLKRRKHIEIS